MQVAFQLALAIVGNAAYDSLKGQFNRWRSRRKGEPIPDAPAKPRDAAEAEAQFRATPTSLGFEDAEIDTLKRRIRDQLGKQA